MARVHTDTIHVLWKLEGVDFSYKENENVLNRLNLEFFQGRIYGILGPNGSGKTTLLDLLGGIHTPCSGRVLFKSRDLIKYKRKELARKIAVVPQEFQMRFSFSVLEAVTMGLHPHIPRFESPGNQQIQRMESVMQLLDIAHLRNRPVTMLSGGEKQRVAVARALVQARDALLLDEATSNLDVFHTLSILNVIKKRAEQENLCVVAALHDISLASSFCDELIFLHHGRVRAQGTPESILDEALLKEIYGVDAHVRKDDFTGGIAVSFRIPEAQ